MKDRELLEELFNFLVKRSYIQGDEASVRDMVKRYQQPPLTLYHLVCMQMTKQDYNKLTDLLGRIVEHFSPENIEPKTEELEIWMKGENTGKTIEWPKLKPKHEPT